MEVGILENYRGNPLPLLKVGSDGSEVPKGDLIWPLQVNLGHLVD